jgi:hypothetical protein
MSEIHIGPHTRDDATTAHGTGETHHTFDREINLKAIGKWMAGLLVVTVLVQILAWWFVEGIERFDKKQDPELTPIQKQIGQKEPPEPRLQVGQNFYKTNKTLNEGEDPGRAIPSGPRSDLEDMQLLREQEDEALDNPSWIDRGQGRVRVPIDVAMEVIASRGAEGVGGAAGVGTGGSTGTVTPQEMREQLPAGTSPGLPGATVQMSRPPAPAQPNEQPAGTAQPQAAPRPPASQEQ